VARRQLKKKTLKKALFIVCEGKNTEPLYIKGLIEQVENVNDWYAFHVKVHDTPKTNPVGLIEVARQLLTNPNDEAWVVYDMDGYTKHHEAFDLAHNTEPQVNIAYSSVSFEEWVLLHFERSDKAYAKSKNIIDHIVGRNFMRTYSKRSNFHLYPKLKLRTHIAIENAAWLRYRMQAELQEAKGQFYRVNPYTTIDKLISKLLGLHEKVLWTQTTEELYTNNLIICVKSAVQVGGVLLVELEIENKKPSAFVLNAGLNEVYVRDKHFEKCVPIRNERLMVGKNETFWFTFEFQLSGPPEAYRFYLEVERTKCIVQL
jgi:hypothetical protein